MSVAEWSGSLLDWERELSLWKARLGPVFRRSQLRETGGAFLDGLLSGIERKTGWMMAEQAGLSRPWRMQGLLGRNRWDADALRNEVRAYAVEALGCPDGVLVVDETGFVKKGRHSVGVARQYTGTAGRVENSQVGVFLAYAGRFGQALIDRRLYLPRDWAEDGARRAKTGVPDEVAFATKPVLAREMIGEALDTGVPCAFVLADAVYGSDSGLRRMLEERGQSYVLAVRSNHTLRFLTPAGLIQTDPATIADGLEDEAWAAHAAGEGSKGPRIYDWARIAMPALPRRGPGTLAADPPLPQRPAQAGLLSRLLPRRHDARRTGRRCRSAMDHRGMLPEGQGRSRPRSLRGPLLARMASPCQPRHGRRRLPRQTCRRPAPRRIRQTERNESRPGNRRLTLLAALVPSVPEIKTLLARLVFKTPNRPPDIIQWSLWRRKHQASAAVSHYKRRQNPQL